MNVSFSHLVTTFFTAHLGAERGLSPNTLASYSDCVRLLVNYLCDHLGIQPEAIDAQAVTPERVLEFLDHVETQRAGSPATRNQRLAAIKTFFHFLARNVPELMHANERIQAIRSKRTDHHPPPSLTVEEVDAILARPDAGTLQGARDKALLQLMYNTGARVQELADIDLADVRFEAPPAVTVTGKGRKTRVVPLWDETVGTIAHYLELRKRLGIDSAHLFLSSRGGPMTRFGIGRRVALHAAAAADGCPSLRGRNVTPHVFRHTTALHLVEAGNDIFVLRDWLGHAHIKTSAQYVQISMERKRKALEKMPPPDGGLPPETAQWRQPAVMEFLLRCSRRKSIMLPETRAPAACIAQNKLDSKHTPPCRNITSCAT